MVNNCSMIIFHLLPCMPQDEYLTTNPQRGKV
jgi:hypothetical protein